MRHPGHRRFPLLPPPGAPLVVDIAELEVLRLTFESAGRLPQSDPVVSLSAVGLLLLPLFWVEPKVFKVLVLLSGSLAAFGIFALLQSVWQLHYTLNPKTTKETSARSQPAVAAALTTALPATALASITEGTTELLSANLESQHRRTAYPAPRRVLATGEIDDCRPI